VLVQELPDTYLGLDDVTLISRIKAVKQNFGKKLLLLAHHYQRQEIVDIADFVGDSYDLSLRAAEHAEAKFIVFCGVRFMAESAAILAQPHQVVIHPDVTAGCPLADMADIDQVQQVWWQLSKIADVQDILPIVYINSDSQLKAFCGSFGGTVCTSANASQAIKVSISRNFFVLIKFPGILPPQTPD